MQLITKIWSFTPMYSPILSTLGTRSFYFNTNLNNVLKAGHQLRYPQARGDELIFKIGSLDISTTRPWRYCLHADHESPITFVSDKSTLCNHIVPCIMKTNRWRLTLNSFDDVCRRVYYYRVSWWQIPLWWTSSIRIVVQNSRNGINPLRDAVFGAAAWKNSPWKGGWANKVKCNKGNTWWRFMSMVALLKILIA